LLDLTPLDVDLYRSTSINDVIPLMPNPSIQFTGWTNVIAKLKEHFLTSLNGQAQKRKYFLLYGMSGIGMTHICKIHGGKV